MMRNRTRQKRAEPSASHAASYRRGNRRRQRATGGKESNGGYGTKIARDSHSGSFAPLQRVLGDEAGLRCKAAVFNLADRAVKTAYAFPDLLIAGKHGNRGSRETRNFEFSDRGSLFALLGFRLCRAVTK